MTRHRTPLCTAFCLVLLLTACGGGGGSGVSGGNAAALLCGGVALPAASPKTALFKPRGADSAPILPSLPIKSEGVARAGITYPDGFAPGLVIPRSKTHRGPRAVGTSDACKNLNLGANPAADGASFTISGRIVYEDHIATNLGFTGITASLPVRGASVELVRCSDAQVLNPAPFGGLPDQTDQNGQYSIAASNPIGNSAGVYVRVLAESLVTDAGVRVTDTGGTLYAVTHAAVDERNAAAFTNQDIFAADTDLNSDGIIDVRAGAPFNIMDVALTGIDYLRAQLGIATPLPDLRMIWEKGVTASTVFMPGPAPTITLTSLPNAASPDTDEYDDSVIMHEMGHFVAEVVSLDSSPGGDHTLTDDTQDARLAWSEGWGNFYAGAALGQTQYLDTGGSSLLIGFDLETLGRPIFGRFFGGSGATNELAVAGTLWDAFDSPLTDLGDDLSDLGPGPIMASLADLKGTTTPVTMGRFVGKLQARMLAQESANFTQAAALHGVDLTADSGSDDSIAGATPLPTPLPGNPTQTTGNLASAPNGNDQDHFAVTLKAGQRYAICTFALNDGADTALELIPAGGTTPTLSNDNFDNQTYGSGCTLNCPANTTTTLASTLNDLNPQTDTNYTIRVKRADAAPPSTGLFGGYRLLITTLP